ncbi:2-keto-4-pentenoate hydratase [Paraburkholderia sp.]|uniref:2-keto-4-pentenoate hydratase n=1 Tax=Paraburkholderia sp. TaxID=1926495 RepID=UPI002385DA0B|nr:2-keto-4-pentenoate hydratase [Paraburkholderia sp.]MDE1180299.1 2-keto-4-pentenoate hydratase [Paraburkholderia sp.]
MTDTVSATSELSRRLVDAQRTNQLLDTLPPEQIPADGDAAYAIQHEILTMSGAQIGGWKIGAKSADGPIQGAPLPASGVHADGVSLPRNVFSPLGLELEIAFRFGRRFEPSSEPYLEADVFAGIDAIGATIEIVASRYAAWPDVDKRAQLADLQNHGALICGEFTPYRSEFPFVAPALRFSFDGRDITPTEPSGRGTNPAGDPRRLLTWFVNHCTQYCGIAVTPDLIVTAGSYTGMFFPQTAGTASGRIEGLAPVSVTLF